MDFAWKIFVSCGWRMDGDAVAAAVFRLVQQGIGLAYQLAASAWRSWPGRSVAAPG
jgi:hypothetical protein